MKPVCKLLMMLSLIACLLVGCAAQGGKTTAAQDSAAGSGDAEQENAGQQVVAVEELLKADTAWRFEPEEGSSEPSVVRELYLNSDGTFRYRSGDPFSEFSYWTEGKWKLENETITFQFHETDEEGNQLDQLDLHLAKYKVSAAADSLTLTLEGSAGFIDDTEGEAVVYQAYSN